MNNCTNAAASSLLHLTALLQEVTDTPLQHYASSLIITCRKTGAPLVAKGIAMQCSCITPVSHYRGHWINVCLGYFVRIITSLFSYGMQVFSLAYQMKLFDVHCAIQWAGADHQYDTLSIKTIQMDEHKYLNVMRQNHAVPAYEN